MSVRSGRADATGVSRRDAARRPGGPKSKSGRDEAVRPRPADTTVADRRTTARRHGVHKNKPGRGKAVCSRAEDTTTTRPEGFVPGCGTRSPGGTHVSLTGIGGRPTGGTALRRGRGQARCTAHQGGVKTKSKRGHRSSREGGTTTQGVPAPRGPSSGVGPRGRGGPAGNTRCAKGFTRTTIPRGGSQARRGFPGGGIAEPGTAGHPSTLRD